MFESRQGHSGVLARGASGAVQFTSLIVHDRHSSESPASTADQAQTFVDWTRNQLDGAGLVATRRHRRRRASAIWFYGRSQADPGSNAEKALMQRQAVDDGREPAARAERPPEGLLALRVDVGRGRGGACCSPRSTTTPASTRTGSTLLDKASGSGAASDVQSTIRSLEGDGYAQMGKLADAAKTVRSCGRERRTFETEKAALQGQGGAGVPAGRRHGHGAQALDARWRPIRRRSVDGGRGAGSARRADGAGGEAIGDAGQSLTASAAARSDASSETDRP